MEEVAPPKEVEKEKLEERLWRAFSVFKNKEEGGIFLSEFLTPSESERLSKRLEVLKKLRTGASYEDIKRLLQVTDATIAQMSNLLKRAASPFLRVLDTLIQKNQVEEKEKFTGTEPQS
ncbi:MAG: Trp family transcriptional regulator [Candidatus Aerophobetes bacterium]|nr:Trp family transcriptional regulator [Candidatus Aerophobetes bacterium]